ncbi:MAG: hypothetical protein C5B47_06745 [Verrucomicrobia bacterium]|nr:MAG: hypothetical protein C5B47_06745 [Verrucomicrobiota bacterium]
MIGISIFSSQAALAQWAVKDAAAFSALSALWGSQQAERKAEVVRHEARMRMQDLQHQETLGQWGEHIKQLKVGWEILKQTRSLINRQLGFIQQIQNVTDNPLKLMDITLQHLDKEIFSRDGLVDDIANWLKQSETFSEWEKLLEELFKPFDIKKVNSDELGKARLKRRETIERAHREAEALQSKSRTLREKLMMVIQGIRVSASASTTITGMQRVGLHLALTEKGMRSAIGVGEDLASRLRDLKTRADNRDVLEGEAERQIRHSKHQEAGKNASLRARFTYDDTRRRRRPRNRISAGVSVGSNGKVRTHSSMRVSVPVKYDL